jgi:hypothetical protein
MLVLALAVIARVFLRAQRARYTRIPENDVQVLLTIYSDSAMLIALGR